MTSQTDKQTFARQILPNTTKSKGYQKMKLSQLIERNVKKYFSLKIIQKMKQGDQFQTSLCFLKEIQIMSK